MQVGFSIFGEVKINHDVHSLDINTTREKIRADKVARNAISEIMEDLVAVLLKHFGVRIETGVAELRDFLRKELDSVSGIAKDDGLVDLQFREESIEAVDLLLFFHKRVVLGDAAKGELIHQVDLIGVAHMFVLNFT